MLERNPLGMFDSCVEKITPAEAVQALLSHETQEAAVAEWLAVAEKVNEFWTVSFTVKSYAWQGKMPEGGSSERLPRDDDARSVSSKSPSSLIGRVISAHGAGHREESQNFCQLR
ncbi:hypothetical protein TrVFT333_002154 [Trichoderma virens FT-333]|nr:hypothetical protein TrVFT333_002154 [Trichoderma virens FT-333]